VERAEQRRPGVCTRETAEQEILASGMFARHLMLLLLLLPGSVHVREQQAKYLTIYARHFRGIT
jgi:hypothetical protein